MSARLTRAMLSDHVRSERAKQEAADFSALAIVAFLAAAFVLGIVLSAAA